MSNLYAEILIPRKMHGNNQETLTYSIPKENSELFKPGLVVEVPLKNKLIRGIIWETHDQKPSFNTKPITNILTNTLSLNQEQLDLAKYLSNYYLCPLYKIIKNFLPAQVFIRKKTVDEINPPEKTEFNPPHLELTPEQKNALQQIQNSSKTTILLHGITGSGKTEIYRRLTLEQIKLGKQVLILVPEISLTPQTVKNFQHQFGPNIAVLHSRLTPKQKSFFLTNIFRQNFQIIIGSRSAIFAPYQNLGLIVIDEEHEDSYKQDNAPRYHVRELAQKICELNQKKGITTQLILGSATPAIESYYQAKLGHYELVEMNQRVPIISKNGTNLAGELPKIHLVDLREELKKKNYSIFSELLQEKIAQNLKNKEQTILFLNRRGAASAVICRDCGHVENCPSCELALTYHSRLSVEDSILPAQRLICHHCGRIFKIPTACQKCQSHRIKYIGLGTQKIEEEILKLYPEARVLRADRDTTKKQNDFADIYHAFRDNKADILIGTQMIGKGLHLPNVTLVGVVLADTTLTIPDFRSAEKTFQLLTQVAGRSGREKPGEVVIQTYLPDHYAIQNTLRHNYQHFYQQELTNRQETNYPPFSKLIKLTIEDPDQQKAYFRTHQLANDLEQFLQKNLELKNEAEVSQINSFPALLPRLKNKFRWQILLTGQNPQSFLEKFSFIKPLKSDIKIDVDPLHTV